MSDDHANMAHLSGAAILCLLLAACASEPPPTAQLAVAGTRISDAEHAGALQYAPVPMNRARTELANAQAASRDGDNKTARRLAIEAAADARLAEVTAQAAHAENAVAALRQDQNTLQQQAAPTAPAPRLPVPSGSGE